MTFPRSARLVTGALLLVALAALACATLLHWRAAHGMAARLAALSAQEGIWDNRFDQQSAKAADLLASLPGVRDPRQRFELLRAIAQHQLQGGNGQAAIATLQQLLGSGVAALPAADLRALRGDLATAWLRLAEQQNCQGNHNADSCIFPLKEGGLHGKPLGATQAIALLRGLLDDPETDAQQAAASRWLLNLAYMALGEYPQSVPKKFLIGPEAFASSHDIGAFRDEAVSRHADVFGLAGGVVLEDFDNDGHLDLLTSSMGVSDPMTYLHNRGDGRFENRTQAAGLAGITGGLNLVQADYDNDGYIDVLVLRGAWLHDHGRFPPSLLHNNGDGSFTDVTERAGLLAFYPTQTAVWADFNGDGWLDLFIGYEIDREHVEWPPDARNFSLYLGNRDGRFREAGAASGIAAAGMIKGVTADDYDNDGRPDLYVSILGAPNHLYRNLGSGADGQPHFADVTAQAGVAGPVMSFPCWFFDYDNDGRPDLFVSGYATDLANIALEALGQPAQGERPRLYHNNGDGTFADVTHAAQLDRLLLSMGSNFGDLDNDGWPDFYLGTGSPPLNMLIPNRMFHNDGGKRFDDVTTSGGFGHLQKGHGVAFGDVDGDGNQDVFEVMGGAFEGDRFWSALYRNPGHGNHWLGLELRGVQANRYGVGARIRVRVREAGAARDIWWTANSGGSFGASSLRPHLGLGAAAGIDSIEVRWPGSGLTQKIAGPIASDRKYRITEGRDMPDALP